ncbi:hypothetical protein A1O7_01433 [Cladophialophora yegresii CBS 114405]|uniref:Cytochrome P450 oxidoreductase n=1 Tax=Cladophialophora yegresii CBS 114405 TaxID=1182544 RepID=W9WAX5_9EURO|nr:uncharacterized protein A1O7_01433 [Cladophialophora yegresii CBS 114405]EXJ65093.1 hypothetical protein A1O7_01433 [Cladophialophora yegresii CBS 114405]
MFLLILVVFILVVLYSRSGRGSQWPDGPRGIPFIGILPDKKLKLYEQLANLVPQYGDFFSLQQGLSKVIVLSSPAAVDELMVKRGGKYGSRPTPSAQAKIVGQGRLVAMEYGDDFRKHRKLMHNLLGMQNAKIFLPYQEYESRQTLKNLLEGPDSFLTEVARYSASVTFSLLLGARFDSNDAKTPEAIRCMFQDMFNKLRPGYWLADWIPLLNYLPDSLAPWRAEARRTHETMMDFWSVPFDAIVDRMQNGTPPDCFLTRFLASPEAVNFSFVERRSILATILTAGSETTATTLQWFFKAAVVYPDFVKAAREELDRVVGPARFPSWQDRPNLPYIAAILDELHRWASVAPVAAFHATSESDSYRGKTIPAGTTVINNVYHVHHTDEYYGHHERFMPERYLSEKDPRYRPCMAHAPIHYGFGVGRRECPGKHVADASLFIIISRMLWAFDIQQGPHPPPSDEVVGGFPVILPAKFACSIRPRSAKVAEIIRAEAAVQDASAQLEDASQYEEQLLEVLEQKHRSGKRSAGKVTS